MTIPENVIPLINIGLAAWLVIAVIIGYKKGFIWEVLTVLGVLVAIMVSWVVAPGLADIIYIFPKNIAPFQGTNVGEIVYTRLNYITWFIILFVVLIILLSLIKPLFKAITEIPVLKELNGVLGSVFSAVRTFVFFVLIVYVLNSAVVTNGKDIIDKSWLSYVKMASEKTMSIMSNSFSENVAIQKMLSDPLSLTEEDLTSIVTWLNKSKLSGEQISEFLIKYGIDANKVNELINKIGVKNEG